MREAPNIAAVLFDLDGTLLDTAPDLVRALNATLAEIGLPACRLDEVKPHISGGARAMLGFAHAKATGKTPADFPAPNPLPETDGDLWLRRMLELYEAEVAVHTCFFDGMERVLDELETRGLPWGIVTNKISRFTDPLVDALNLNGRSGCVISGDTTAHAKPHPLPLLEACRRLGKPPQHCVYIGDAARDVEAGRRAGMATLGALYGYIAAADDPLAWGADGLLAAPVDLLAWLDGGART